MAVDFTSGLRPRHAAPEEPNTGRDVLHTAIHAARIQGLATAEHPAVKSSLTGAIKSIHGAKIHGARDKKPAGRLLEKIDAERQPPRTIPDYSAFRVAVDSPEAKDKAVKAIRGNFEVIRDKDEFDKGAPDTGFHAHMMQVKRPGSAVSHEVQVLPREQADAAEANHGLYDKARDGDKDAGESIKAKNKEAKAKFDARNGVAPKSEKEGGRGESPEQASGGAPKQPSPDSSKAQLKTGVTVKLPDGRTGVVKGISPKGDVVVKLAGGGRARSTRTDVQVVDTSTPAKGVTVGTPGHDRPTAGAIAVDLDKTMAEYTTFKGAAVIGKPIAAQVDQVKKMLADGKDVWIYSARVEHPDAIPAIKEFSKENIGKELPMTNIKYPEFAKFIDDRAELPVQMQREKISA